MNGVKCEFLYTDTVLLVLVIPTEDVYANSTTPVGMKVLGKMKDEYAGIPITEFMGLRPKIYKILKVDGVEKHKACKNASFINTYDMSYKEVLFEVKTFRLGHVA